MNKQALRKEFLKKRAEFATNEASLKICRLATGVPQFLQAKTVMIYLSCKSEVDTSPLLEACKKAGKCVCAPVVLDDKTMIARQIDEKGLRPGRFGIPEPLGEIPDKIDLVFVPGVVFSKDGYRIGYGKGYYDRFLKTTNAVAFGLAFSFQVVDALPFEAHDIPLNAIITEEGILL